MKQAKLAMFFDVNPIFSASHFSQTHRQQSNFWMRQPHFDHAKYRKQALLNQPLWVGWQGVTMQISAARAETITWPLLGGTQGKPKLSRRCFCCCSLFREVILRSLTQDRSTQDFKTSSFGGNQSAQRWWELEMFISPVHVLPEARSVHVLQQ